MCSLSHRLAQHDRRRRRQGKRSGTGNRWHGDKFIANRANGSRQPPFLPANCQHAGSTEIAGIDGRPHARQTSDQSQATLLQLLQRSNVIDLDQRQPFISAR